MANPIRAIQAMRRTTAAILIIVLQLQGISAARAGTNANLDAMWNTTQAQAYNNSQGVGLFGGSFALRVPVRNFTLMSFDPPRITAGCSGIDIHFGAFSMLNSEQFKMLARAIVQNAAVYLVHLAIGSMCDECSRILTYLTKTIQEISNQAKNTCALGKKLASAIYDGVGSSASSKSDNESARTQGEASYAASMGAVTDLFKGFWDQTIKGPDTLRQLSELQDTGYANLLVNSLITTGAIDSLETTVLGDDMRAVELMINIFGTEKISTSDKLSGSSTPVTAPRPDTGDSALESSTNKGGIDQDMHTPLLRLAQLRDGANANPAPDIRICDDFYITDPLSCQNVKIGPMTYKGVYTYVVNMVAGPQQDSDGVFIRAEENSLAGKIRTGTPLTTSEMLFMRAFSVNMGMLLVEAAGAPGNSYDALVERIVGLMADEITVLIGRAMVKTVYAAFPGQSMATGKLALPMPKWMAENVKEFEKQMVAFMPEGQWESMQRQISLLKSIRALREFGAPNMTGGR